MEILDIDSVEDFLENLDIEQGVEQKVPEINNVYQLERVLKSISRIDDDTEIYKELKRQRVEPIDREIKKLAEKKEYLRQLCLESVKALYPNKKTIKLPGVATATIKNNKAKWELEDEDKFIAFLEKNELDKSNIIETKKVVLKKNIESTVSLYLAKLEDGSEGEASDDVSIDGLSRKKAYDNVSIRFDDKASGDVAKKIPTGDKAPSNAEVIPQEAE